MDEKYYEARKDYLETLLKGDLSAKQRRQAEYELNIVNVKLLRIKSGQAQ